MGDEARHTSPFDEAVNHRRLDVPVAGAYRHVCIVRARCECQ